MAKWSKKTFIEHINQSCENDVAVNCLQLIDFSEKNSDEITWGTGDGCGLSLIHISEPTRPY